jgi:hypothetical protein
MKPLITLPLENIMTFLSKRLKLARTSVALLGLLLALAGGVAMLSWGADHRDGPIFVNTAASGQHDLNDIYIFQSPANSANTVMIMDVSPFPGNLTPATFDPATYFDFKLDNNGDAVEDMTFRVTFGPPDSNGVQNVTLRGLPAVKFPNFGILAKGKTGQNLPVAGGGMFRAAVHDDPFFFDSGGFSSYVKDGDPVAHPFPRAVGTAHNFFGPNVNTLACILEVPTSLLLSSPSNPKIGVWIRTEVNGVQVDRMGRPAINTALIPPSPRNDLSRGERRNAYNAGLPRNDQRDFRADMIAVLMKPLTPDANGNRGLFGRNLTDASALADFLFPDILTYDTSKPAGYTNGRTLRDDVIDITFNLLTAGRISTDNVGDDNGPKITDGNFGTTPAFPYIGAANTPLNGPGTGPNP